MAHEQWRSHLDYIITLLGYGVGSGAFIRFPFYCMRNGGGAYLILFMFFTIIGTIPCVFLEMTIGQFSQSGPIKVWNMCPAFKVVLVDAVVGGQDDVLVGDILVYITVILPYILILVFLIRGCLLPGSADGIYYFIFPKFDKLTDPKVWIHSCRYALFSMGIAMGCIITMSGHNRKDNNCFRDAIIICLMDSLSNVFFGFAFFCIVGHVAFQRGVTVEAFESSGYDLAFIVYPEVLSALPLPPLWSVMTFLTFMLLAIDSAAPSVELIIAALEDMFPRLMKRRWLIIGAVLLSLFLFGLIYISQGGIYVVTLMDWYAYFPSTAVFGILECIAVICCYSFYSYRPPKYGDYIYPAWATTLGWLISFSSLLPFPIVFIWTVYKTQGGTVKEVNT
ncbi:sodium- and chloride-dependent glycine transporter 2-like [Haliotis rubra]|uniref:sodium- and chloride-dependent glycine transporter 2-like n=1 Tax=Haliotis rubra TaxID=36100 RepID=UPI001EE57777|nr:sodium- and chloride-dependent glycine transporter 2-like [Haliotis rubra]